jgi:hypothetical protein
MTQEATPVGGEPAPVTDPKDAFTQLAAEEFGVTDEPDDKEPVEGEPIEGEAEEAEDEPEIEEEADDLPPIEPPVS